VGSSSAPPLNHLITNRLIATHHPPHRTRTYILLNNKIVLPPKVAPINTTMIVAGRLSCASKGPTQEAGRVSAIEVGGRVMFWEARQAAEYAAKAGVEPARGSGIWAFWLISSVNMHCSQARMAETVALLHRQESFVSPQVWMAWFAGSHED